MNIGEAAKASGVSAKMLRYYESIGLIPAIGRSASGYRVLGDREVETLRFIRRARDFGIPMDRVKLLVGLWQDGTRPSREVKRIAVQQVADLDARILELTAMRDALAGLARACRGDSRPDCPILMDLAGESRGPARPHSSKRTGSRFGDVYVAGSPSPNARPRSWGRQHEDLPVQRPLPLVQGAG